MSESNVNENVSNANRAEGLLAEAWKNEEFTLAAPGQIGYTYKTYFPEGLIWKQIHIYLRRRKD